MARPSMITLERVAAVADMLKEKNINPTARAVRAELGTGSMATVCKLLREWHERERPAHTTNTHEIPPAVASAISAFISSKVAEETLDAREQLADAKDALEAAIQENERLEEKISQLESALAESQNDRAKLSGLIEQLRADIASVESRLTQERQKAESVGIELAKAESRLGEIPRLQGELDATREALSKAKEEAAELRGRFSVAHGKP